MGKERKLSFLVYVAKKVNPIYSKRLDFYIKRVYNIKKA